MNEILRATIDVIKVVADVNKKGDDYGVVDQRKSRDQRPVGKRNTFLPSTETLVHFGEVLVDILAWTT